MADGSSVAIFGAFVIRKGRETKDFANFRNNFLIFRNGRGGIPSRPPDPAGRASGRVFPTPP